MGQLGQQLGAQQRPCQSSAMVTAISAASGSRVPDVAGDAHAVPVGAAEGADRLVVVVVDLGEEAQLHR